MLANEVQGEQKLHLLLALVGSQMFQLLANLVAINLDQLDILVKRVRLSLTTFAEIENLQSISDTE